MLCTAPSVNMFFGPQALRHHATETALANHCRDHGGAVEVKDLSDLFARKPWLKPAVKHLKTFADASEKLGYCRHAPGGRAVLAVHMARTCR